MSLKSLKELNEGDELVLAIRPEALELHEQIPKNKKIVNLFEARIKKSIFLGNMVQYLLEVGQHEFMAEDVSRTMFEEGKKLFLSIPPGEVEVITKF